MRILVCMSSVPDTTLRPVFTADGSRLETAGIQWVINPWDELSLTRALELKEASGGAIEAVNVACAGGQAAEVVLRKALAIGADAAFRLDLEAQDSFQCAEALAALLKTEAHDLILCGPESSDYNGAALPGMLSELSALPSVAAVSTLDFNGGKLVLKRECLGASETIEASPPLLISVAKGIANEPRIPSMRGVMAARTKPLKVIAHTLASARVSLRAFEPPPARKACQMVSADNVGELLRLLHDDGIL